MLTREKYLDMYLHQQDIPLLQHTLDSRFKGPDAGDESFASCGGLVVGKNDWAGGENSLIAALNDIRFAFPDASSATRYHRERVGYNGEGTPPFQGAPPVGSQCAVFGGTMTHPVLRVEMTAFFYVFCVSSVVVKIFALQNSNLPTGSLKASDVATVAMAAEKRVLAALSSP